MAILSNSKTKTCKCGIINAREIERQYEQTQTQGSTLVSPKLGQSSKTNLHSYFTRKQVNLTHYRVTLQKGVSPNTRNQPLTRRELAFTTRKLEVSKRRNEKRDSYLCLDANDLTHEDARHEEFQVLLINLDCTWMNP